MKRLLIGLMTVSLLLAGTSTLARGNHDRRGHHAPRPPAHQGHHRPHHRPDRRPHHHHHDGYRGAYLLGGVALGAVLADAFSYRDPAVVYVEPSSYPRTRVIYRDRPVTTTVISEPEWSLLRDLSGNCYEVSTDDYGRESRTPVPASECDW